MDNNQIAADIGVSFLIPGLQVAGGISIPDTSFGTLDGVADFKGSIAGLSLQVEILGHASVDELVLGDEVTFNFLQGSFNVGTGTAFVISTNVTGGSVLLGGGDLLSVFNVAQIAFLDEPDLDGLVTLEIGPSTEPVLISSTPTDNAAWTDIGNKISFHFNENMVAIAGVITLHDAANGAVLHEINVQSNAVSITNNIVEVTLSDALLLGGSYYINIESGALRGVESSAFSGISDDHTLNFSVGLPNVTATFSEDDTGRKIELLDGNQGKLDVENLRVSTQDGRNIGHIIQNSLGEFTLNDSGFEDLAQGEKHQTLCTLSTSTTHQFKIIFLKEGDSSQHCAIEFKSKAIYRPTQYHTKYL